MASPQQEHSINLPLVERENTFLPLAIDVVCRYWGEEIAAPEKNATIIEAIELAERRGFGCHIYKGSIKDLKKRIDQGIPPIVILPGIREMVQHATIVSGYNSEERRIITYVPEPDTVGAIPDSKFEHDWEQDDMTTIILFPEDMMDLFKNENLKFKDSNRICFEAEKLRQQGKVNEALEKLKKAAEIDKDNPQAWCLMAGIYNELGSEHAVSCYEKALAFNPKYYLAYRGLGNYYLKRKDYPLAEAYYTKAIETNPARFGPIYKNRAVARLQVNNQSGAKEDLQKYLKQLPDAPDRKTIEDALSQM